MDNNVEIIEHLNKTFILIQQVKKKFSIEKIY